MDLGHFNEEAAFYVKTLNEESLVIRINGPNFGVFDRTRERKYQEMLQAAGIIDYILGMFKNGVVMRNIPGSNVHEGANLTPEIEAKIARKFANLHANVPVMEEFFIGGPDSNHVLSKFVYF